MEQTHEGVKGVFYTMEQINMTKYLPCTTRLVGGTLYILDGEGVCSAAWTRCKRPSSGSR